MSDADRVGLAYYVESTYGVTPAGNPTIQDLRYTSESLRQDTGSVSSAEIRSDRQVTDVIRTSVSSQGDIALELSYSAYDEWLQAGLLSAAWSSTATETDTDISAANTDNSLNTAGGDFVADGFLANQWIKVSGFTGDTTNNGYMKIVSVATGKMIVSGKTLVDDAAGESVTILMGAQIVNGTTLSTFTIEKVFADLASEFALYNGCAIDSVALNIATEAIVTGTFGFMGKQAVSAAATFGDGSNDAAATNDIMNTVDDITSILEGQATYATTAFSMTLGNNLRTRLQVGTLGAVSVGTGKVALSGTLQAYYATKTLMDKYLNDTATSLAVVFEDGDGNAYIIDMPQVKFTSGQRVAGGENTDVIADMAFTAYREATEDITIRIARFAA